MSNLGAALGAHGALPGWLARGHAAGEVPRRSLSVVSTLTLLALLTVIGTGVGTEPLVRLTNVALVAVYVGGTAAAVRPAAPPPGTAPRCCRWPP